MEPNPSGWIADYRDMDRRKEAKLVYNDAGIKAEPAPGRPARTATGERIAATDLKRWTLRRAAGWIGVLAGGFALAFWLRYGVIQPTGMGIACGAAEAPGWCAPRQWLISAQHYRVWGWVGLAAGLIGLFAGDRWGGRWAVAIALFFSAMALVLYNATLGAPATVIALLALLRR
jgi:hypothetical protein